MVAHFILGIHYTSNDYYLRPQFCQCSLRYTRDSSHCSHINVLEQQTVICLVFQWGHLEFWQELNARYLE